MLMVSGLGLIKAWLNFFQCANDMIDSQPVCKDGRKNWNFILRPVIYCQLGNQIDAASPCRGGHSCRSFSKPNYFVFKTSSLTH